MEIWKRVMKMIHAWEHTKRLKGTTQQEDEDIFANALNNEFLLLERDKIKEVRFEDEYVVYLVNEEESNEERNYDA
tara:strand:- start:271 stop:498 length:228 start_codon:yes stop_codon:yes gene_type:complete